MQQERKMSIFAKILLFATTIMWGASFFILKNTLTQIPVFTLLSIRFGLSLVIMLIIFFPRLKKITKTVVWKGLLSGVFLGLAYILSGFGMKNTTPSNAAFLVSTYCVMVPFMIWIAKKKRPALLNFVAVFICMLGIGLITLQNGFKFNYRGDGLTLIAAVALAINMVLLAVYAQGEDVMLLTTFQYLPTLVVSILGMLIFERGQAVFTRASIGGMLYLAIPCTVMALGFISFGLKHTSAISAGLILSLESVFGVIFSVIFYKEVISWLSYVAFAIIFVAVLMSEVLPIAIELIKSKRDKVDEVEQEVDNIVEKGEEELHKVGLEVEDIGDIIDDETQEKIVETFETKVTELIAPYEEQIVEGLKTVVEDIKEIVEDL